MRQRRVILLMQSSGRSVPDISVPAEAWDRSLHRQIAGPPEMPEPLPAYKINTVEARLKRLAGLFQMPCSQPAISAVHWTGKYRLRRCRSMVGLITNWTAHDGFNHPQ